MQLYQGYGQQLFYSLTTLLHLEPILHLGPNFGRFPSNKSSGLKFRKLHVLNGTILSDSTDPTQATARFVIVALQHTHICALKVKSKYCLYPKEHSTVEKGRWKTKGGGILSCRKPMNASEGKKFL